ncbi:hypothetical protein T492DRAFT_941195 [Pavlovales sp. CCMP2436]|nr:hypothetical protein T492DRAFT_941195 [Pavlovales sp. CCMP2436]
MAAACEAQDFGCFSTQPQTSTGWTYNDVISGGAQQQLFCKMQSFDTTMRSTTAGPKLISAGYVAGAVGLSNVQFGASTAWPIAGQLACGMCLKATLTDTGMYNMNCELDAFDSGTSSELTFMVVDQCKDDKCVDNGGGWLDLDSYGAGASLEIAWNSQFMFSVFDARVPVVAASFACDNQGTTVLPYRESVGYVSDYNLCLDGEDLTFTLTSYYGDILTFTLEGGLPNLPATKEPDQTYQLLVPTDAQFPSQSSTPSPALYPSQGTGGPCTSEVRTAAKRAASNPPSHPPPHTPPKPPPPSPPLSPAPSPQPSLAPSTTPLPSPQPKLSPQPKPLPSSPSPSPSPSPPSPPPSPPSPLFSPPSHAAAQIHNISSPSPPSSPHPPPLSPPPAEVSLPPLSPPARV